MNTCTRILFEPGFFSWLIVRYVESSKFTVPKKNVFHGHVKVPPRFINFNLLNLNFMNFLLFLSMTAKTTKLKALSM